ncbi:uncharacterized protein Dana_GF13242, isoform A [Drosophila ananassae]|uniref:Uncharacterized protein, isoform A n=1 Tax=Drosophila ananassae TaxID=7217 RepID=B3MIG0_DROAN|nr:histone-lysine N-methyltransferase 2D isoform X1 [Drosophila ananassae]EDV37008.1 uncharacterized protein Dana_GF13242, isoform A [Drosophila ananassae]
MAATPPMPPGSNSDPLNGSHPEAKVKAIGQGHNHITEAINQHFQRKNQNNQEPPAQQQNQSHPGSRRGSNEHGLELLEDSAEQSESSAVQGGGTAKPSSCHCTNISIMHLFHEMKQEFPTIPDAIVTQCVNENCHQRDNCIQMLRKEFALQAVQSYPSKVLQQQQQQNRRPTKPPTPLKPLRAAPVQPEVAHSNGNTTSSPTPRPVRPTTLNLQRPGNTQLQMKIQQRQQRQQRDPPQQQLTPTSLSKPLRRAPPLPPKPGSFSNDSSCLTSPMSSSESELSLNAVSLSSPTSAAPAPAPAASARTAGTAAGAIVQPQQQPSPVRHRSVITLQPEPPYARDFLTTQPPPSTPPFPSSPSSAASPGRKSFTSLNLTLRQPATGGGAQAAIDITAGPAPSGQGSGITYSSVSFDARKGTHKNFQLTVTDEGSVFSAGCIRPRVPCSGCDPAAVAPPTSHHQPQLPLSLPPPPAVVADGGVGQEQGGAMTPDVFPYPTQEQNHIVASNYSNNHAVNNNGGNSATSSPVSSPTVPLYAGVLEEAHATTIERQKKRRDKLANALRDNRKRLLVLEQEINILTEPVPLGESERLDKDIKKLTEDCQRLLNLINEPQANGSGPAPNSMNRQHSAPAGNAPQQHQNQPQPFPRQRQGGRSQVPPSTLNLHSVPTPSNLQPNQDFLHQHRSAPSSACLTPQQQQQFNEPPPTYAQYHQFQQYLQQQRQQQLQQLQLQQQQQQLQQQQLLQQQQQQQRPGNEEEDYLTDSDVDEDEEPLDMWACNLCTFRNHPQLNICEACENVRIQPGMIRIIPNASGGGSTAAAGSAGTPNGSLEQQQQPQQPYALHT